ncbi:TetR/AcrR family transcriptional regulator [Saccharopolyspora sp. 5N708]|uniref:TetR/AcrR family transcriptional regulator n=1 Tax=Saccharopolyspora sp. 5N708 TaxID=3457424 RepID=UPI003FCFCAFB
MPKRVDHDERRQQIAEAVWRIAVERGLAAASLREVAAEAGISMRLVQYYFDTKQRMLRFALELAGQRFGDQIEQRIRATGPSREPREVARGHLLGLLPLDAESRTLAVISHAFFNAAMVDERIASVVRWYPPIIENAIAEQIRAARPEVDAMHEAEILTSVVRGLIGSVLIGERTPQQAVALVDRQLDNVFAGQRSTPASASPGAPEVD